MWLPTEGGRVTLRYGKLAATHDPRDLLFSAYRTKPTLTEAPVGYGHAPLVKNPFGMLGNDMWGDCAWAGPAHEHMITSAAAGRQVTFTTDAVLHGYSAVTGFNPNAGPPGENPTDQGSNVRDVLKYRAATGLVDAAGSTHKVGAYVALEPGNWDQLLQALYVFEAVGIGIQVPSSAQDQFAKHEPWDVVAGSSIEGGHYVPVVGRQATDMGVCVTWGALQPFTRAFYERFNDEAWAIVSPEMLSGGKSLEGFDLTALQADLATL